MASFDGVDRPGLLKKLNLQVAGTRRQHSLRAGGEIAGRNVLELAAEGGFADDLQKPRWDGKLTVARLAAEERFRSFSLAQAAPLTLGSEAWRIGPLNLDGDPWKLRLAAESGAQRLHVDASCPRPAPGQYRGPAGRRDARRVDA